MLQLQFPDTEFYDEQNEKFIKIKGQTIQLEHSLVSISKWEARWKKPFLVREGHTREETIDYIRCMTITQNVNPLLYQLLTTDQIINVNNYIDDPMTATTISKQEGKGASSKVITSEEIYYAMVAYQIPFECQRWHFNRLMMLIRVCDEKNKPKKKMRKGEIAKRNRSLNAARRARLGTRG